jgi:hypothetical protein
MLEDLRDADDSLAFGRDEDEVAATIDADTSAPDPGDTAQREPPFRAVRIFVQLRIQASFPDDRSEALARPCDFRSRVRAAAPLDDVDPTVPIPEERGSSRAVSSRDARGP